MSGAGPAMEIGSVDVFTYPNAPYVGDVTRLVLTNDGTGFGSGWLGQEIKVTSLGTGREWAFFVKDWLKAEYGPMTLSAYVPSSG